MNKKSRKRKRLLLGKEVVKLLNDSTTQLIRSGIITYPTSAPPEECSAVQGCG